MYVWQERNTYKFFLMNVYKFLCICITKFLEGVAFSFIENSLPQLVIIAGFLLTRSQWQIILWNIRPLIHIDHLL
jgi:hypothetical protein